MRKKTYLLFFLFTLTIAILLAGCNKTNKTNKTNKENSLTEKENLTNFNPIGEYPIVKEKVTLNAFIRTRPACDDFENNDFTKWMEEKTNIHFNWTVALEQDRKQKLNLLLASGNYPEVIFDSSFSASEQYLYGKQNILQPLNELIDKYAPNTKKVLTDYPTIKEDLTMPNKNIYSLPQISECYHCQVPAKMWINTEWLKNLNLEMPTTTDEFYNVLKAFKEQDPNNNNKKDEIPLSGAQKGWLASPEIFIMNAFTYTNDGQKYLQVKDGKIIPSYIQDEWKEGLKYMNKLFEEDLLDPQTFTQNQQQLVKLGENPGECILGAAPGGSFITFSKIEGLDRYRKYATVPALKGPDNERYAYYLPFSAGANFNITDKCKNPIAAIRWADANYEYETMMRQVTGRPGKEWDYAKEGDIGVDGTQADWIQYASGSSDAAKGHTWGQIGPSLRTTDFWLKMKQNETDYGETVLYNESKKNYIPYIPNINQIVPALAFNEEEARIIVDTQTQIDNYVSEKMVRFICGNEDIDKNWDAYLAEFDNLNLDRYLEIYQKAYDAKKSLNK